jgi:hypothetical protein
MRALAPSEGAPTLLGPWTVLSSVVLTPPNPVADARKAFFRRLAGETAGAGGAGSGDGAVVAAEPPPPPQAVTPPAAATAANSCLRAARRLGALSSAEEVRLSGSALYGFMA